MEQLFFELIRVALGTQETLSRPPSKVEWAELYAMAKKQSLVGICFAAVQKLQCNDNQELRTQNPQSEPTQNQESITHNLDEVQYLTWMGMAAKIQQRNQVVDEQTEQFYKKLADDGYKACVLKGQAVNALYGKLRGLRQSGDIDMWMVAEPAKVIEWARATGSMYYYDYHHADLSLYQDPSTGSGQGTEIELHYRPSLSRNLVRNARLQKWFKDQGEKNIVYREDLGFAVPDYVFNVVLTMNHNFWHLMYEGVGMRQLLDLYFILRSKNDNTSTSSAQADGDNLHAETLKLLKHLKLLRFASASMWIMKEVFGLDDEYLLCEPDVDAGRFLLDEIMQAGNFGHHDERLKEGRYKTSRVGLMWAWMKHNLRLIKHYPTDVLWTPIGILRISLWRRWHYRNENELKNI